ncbi:hypothetical protein FGO68_gene7331 [Halteria grandinella]|uniref:Uncharacterized protein n=1 Tax=Halteria grandinella TaxID=5974 RepID=A0A8J8NW52_HALGN|nr:hypothetical protein FGO68_gene7331 [Halteria grandinella]
MNETTEAHLERGADLNEQLFSSFDNKINESLEDQMSLDFQTPDGDYYRLQNRQLICYNQDLPIDYESQLNIEEDNNMFDCTDSILHSSCAGQQSFFEQLAMERELMVIDHSRLQHLQNPSMKNTLTIKPKLRLRSKIRGSISAQEDQERDFYRDQMSRLLDQRQTHPDFKPSGYLKDQHRFEKCLQQRHALGDEDSGDEVNSFKSDHGEPQLYGNAEYMQLGNARSLRRSVVGKKRQSRDHSKNMRSQSVKRKESINQSSASALVNVSGELKIQPIRHKRIKIKRVQDKIGRQKTKDNYSEVRKASKTPPRPASQAVTQKTFLRDRKGFNRCEIEPSQDQQVEVNPLIVMKKSAQGFYKRAGTAGTAYNSRNVLNGGFRSAMSQTNRRLLLNIANNTTTAQSRNQDQQPIINPLKSSVAAQQPYALEGNTSQNEISMYQKFTNNDKVRRYYKGCTQKIEQLALDQSGNSIENFLSKLKPNKAEDSNAYLPYLTAQQNKTEMTQYHGKHSLSRTFMSSNFNSDAQFSKISPPTATSTHCESKLVRPQQAGRNQRGNITTAAIEHSYGVIGGNNKSSSKTKQNRSQQRLNQKNSIGVASKIRNFEAPYQIESQETSIRVSHQIPVLRQNASIQTIDRLKV